MATFDPQAILDAVDTGSGSEPWTIYRARNVTAGARVLTYVFMLVISSFLRDCGFYLLIVSCFATEMRIHMESCVAFIGGLYRHTVASHANGWRKCNLLRQMRSVTSQVLRSPRDGFVALMEAATHAVSDFSPVPASLAWDGHSSAQSALPMTRYGQFSLTCHHPIYEAIFQLILLLRPSARAVPWRIDHRFPDRSLRRALSRRTHVTSRNRPPRNDGWLLKSRLSACGDKARLRGLRNVSEAVQARF